MSTLLVKANYARASGAQPCCGKSSPGDDLNGGHHEDGEEHALERSSESDRRGCGTAGRLASKEQGGRVRQNLLDVWRWFLLYPRHRYLHKDRRLSAF